MKKLKVPAIIFLFALIIFLIFFFRFVYNYDIIVTHLLYIPVILIAFLWQYRVIYAILVIGIALLISDKTSGYDSLIINDIIRILLLMFAGIFVAVMRRYILLFSSYKKYKDILFAVQEPMVIINSSFSIFLSNKNFTATFGIGRKENISVIFGDILHDDGLGDALSICFNGAESLYHGRFTTTGGESRLFEVKCYPIGDNEWKRHAILNLRDITEESEAALKQKRILDRQSIVIDILELLNKKDAGLSVIHEILGLVAENTGIGAIGLKLESDDDYKLYSSAGITVLTDYLRARCAEHESGPEGCFCIRSFSLEQFVNHTDAESAFPDFFWTNDFDEFAQTCKGRACRCMPAAGIKSCAVIPVSSGEEITGFFILADRRKFFFNNELLEFYEGIVQSISIALGRVSYQDHLKQIIDEKELLIREVHHRVKNNMQVITSLISLQASRQTDEEVKSILNECQNRVRTMALVHEKLYSSNNYTSINFGSYINTLVPLLMNSYRISKDLVTVKITAEDIQLDINTAIPLAQLVNEILSNVFKHAFPSDRTGSVEVALTRNTALGINILNINDTGIGLGDDVSFPAGGNLGFQLIQALIRQIRGRVAFKSAGGVSIQVEF